MKTGSVRGKMKLKILIALVVLGSAAMTFYKDVSIRGRLKVLPKYNYVTHYMPAGTVITCPEDNSPVLFTPTGIDGILDPDRFIPLKKGMTLTSHSSVPCDSIQGECYHTANGWRGDAKCHKISSDFFRRTESERSVRCENVAGRVNLSDPRVKCYISTG